MYVIFHLHQRNNLRFALDDIELAFVDFLFLLSGYISDYYSQKSLRNLAQASGCAISLLFLC